MLGVLRTSGLSSLEIKRLDRRDVESDGRQLVVRVRGKKSRIVTITEPDALEAHKKWMLSRLFCAYPAYITSWRSGRMSVEEILRITNKARKTASAQ